MDATSDSGSINGIDITFAGAMNQVNPTGISTIFTDGKLFFGFVGADVSQDSQFLFHSGDILSIGAEEGPELLKAAITNISAHTGGAMSVDIAQIVFADSVPCFIGYIDDGSGMAGLVENVD